MMAGVILWPIKFLSTAVKEPLDCSFISGLQQGRILNYYQLKKSCIEILKDVEN